jgi:hypothetical protein
MLVKLKNVRLAFPQLFEAKTVNGEGEPAYSANFIIERGSPAEKELRSAIKQAAQDKWKGKADSELSALEKKDKVCLHDGDDKSNYDGFAGNLYVSARNKVRPLVIDRDKAPLTKDDGRPYAGCYVNANIDVWVQDNQFGKRINASLKGVQFFREGEAFSGGGASSIDEFDEIEFGDDGFDDLVAA